MTVGGHGVAVPRCSVRDATRPDHRGWGTVTGSFFDVLARGRVVVGASRMAAQIVTGVGFLGAGLPALGSAVTAGYLFVTFRYPKLLAIFPSRTRAAQLRVPYLDGRGALRRRPRTCSDLGFDIGDLSVEREGDRGHWPRTQDSEPLHGMAAHFREFSATPSPCSPSSPCSPTIRTRPTPTTQRVTIGQRCRCCRASGANVR